MKGEGNQQDYGMRVYDPRIGKFLSVDPLTESYPELTPYQFSSNTPIQATDLDGAETDYQQVTHMLLRYNKMKVANDEFVRRHALTETRSNWGGKWRAWNDSKSPTHTWALFSRLAFAVVNDATISYTSAVDGKNHSRGVDNTGVTDYKERVGAGLNTITFFNPISAAETRLEAGLAEEITLAAGSEGAEQATKRLVVQNVNGRKWSLADINPRNREISNVRQNCTNCVVDTDAYLKGAPASALFLEKGRSPSFLENIFGAKFKYNMTIDQIKSSVSNPGDLGIVIGIRANGSAHVFNVYNNRGVVQFLDGQTGKVANLKDNYKFFGLLKTN